MPGLNSLVESSIADTLASLWPFFGPELILCISILGLLLVRLLPFGKSIDAGYLTILGVGCALFVGSPVLFFGEGSAPLRSDEALAVRGVQFEGNQKASAEGLLETTGIKSGESIGQPQLDAAVAALRETGKFSQVAVRWAKVSGTGSPDQDAKAMDVIFVVTERPSELFGGMVVYDSFTAYVRAILLFFTIVFVVFTKFTGMPDRESGTDFYCLIMGALLGMCLMVSANHLLMVFLAVEMASVPSYVLAGVMRGQRPASEASLKYAIYGAGAAGVMLYGISLLAGITNSAHLPTVAARLAESITTMPPAQQMVLVLAALMIMVGLAFKLSAVPFHFWCPDIFEGATAEIGAFLSIASKAAALALLVRVSLGIGMLAPDRGGAADGFDRPVAMTARNEDSSVGLFAVADELDSADIATAKVGDDPLAAVRTFAGMLIGVMAIVTMTFGNLAAYGQTNFKRLLAYSTIAHAGYMMLPVSAALAMAAVAPSSAADAIGAIVLYVVIYMFMNLGAFAVVAFLRNSMGTEEIADFSGLIRRAPVLVICLALIMFSLVGLPPLAGFVGKFALFASLADGYKITGNIYLFYLLVIAGINTAISLFYYLRVVKVMTMDPESDAVSAFPSNIVGSLPVSFVAFVTAPVLLLMIGWGPLSHWSSAAARQLFGG